MTNNLSSISCSSYSEQPEPGFYLGTIKAGETFVIDTDETNRLLFLKSGKFVISSLERQNYSVEQSNIVFCSRLYQYTITAVQDCEMLIARFVTGNVAVEGDTYRSIAAEVSKVVYNFSTVPIVDIMNLFVDSVIYYLRNNVNTMAMHKAKLEEMFVIFRHFYPRDIYLRTFYSLFNNNMSFRTMVINNAPNAKNVEALARMCGHSLSHFKLLFSQHFDVTPYVWMQQNRALEINQLLRDTTIPLKSIIKKYGFTSHGHFSLFCRKFLGNTPRVIRNQGDQVGHAITLEEVKQNMEAALRIAQASRKTVVGQSPRKRGRPRKVQQQ